MTITFLFLVNRSVESLWWRIFLQIVNTSQTIQKTYSAFLYKWEQEIHYSLLFHDKAKI